MKQYHEKQNSKKYNPKLLNFLRAVLHLSWLLLTVIPACTLVLIAHVVHSPQWVHRFCMIWLSHAVWAGGVFLGIRNRVSGLENLPSGELDGLVLLVKHQSLWETFALAAIMPHPLAFVFKKELLKIPFFGWSMACMDMIHIDRSQRSQSFIKIVEQGKRLLAKGTWVILFPEGTRMPRGTVGNYKLGGTRLAIEAGVPVVPVAVTSGKCWPKSAFIKTPGMVDISIGKPISSQGRDALELMQEVQNWIEAEMQRLDADAYRH